MKPQRFELALERLQPAQWKRFEELASEFLSSEFPNLRTMASASGDRGRDAELFSPQDDPSVLLQYSVAEDWETKIVKTVERIKPEFPEVTVLIYATNQIIGAKADKLKSALRKDANIYLDIRDRNWFVERLHSSQQCEAAAERVAQDIVDPYLASREVVTCKATALTSLETRAAFVYLGLQWEDDTREKGLTKLCFEGLIRAVLRDTHSDNRLAREEIRRQIRSVLPNHPSEQVDAYTDSALTRLTKRFIRHWQTQDEFCLMHEERLRLRDRLATYEAADSAFQEELLDVTRRVALKHGLTLNGLQDELVRRIRRVLEKFLLSRGEAFAAAVNTGDFRQMGFEELKEIVIRDIGENPDSAKIGANLVDVVVKVIEDVFEFPSESTQNYLRSTSDAYTLLAFLRETPDVQSAITKMFSEGEVWLDTSIILPLFAEDLLEPENRRFTNLLRAATEAGLGLYITETVLEEVESHLNRCLVCHRGTSGKWHGKLPFLYSLYILSGRAPGDFASWIEQFRGSARPEDDIADYLQQIFGITVRGLRDELENASSELRHAVQEVWIAIHHDRRRGDMEADSATMERLASTDAENYVGVIQRRRVERESPFGYNSWWLTLDRDAFKVRARLQEYLDKKAPASPVMSPDFLVNYLAFGPARRLLSKPREIALPLAIDATVTEFLPPELIALAESVREEMKGSPEHLIRRKVRDRLDAAKGRKGSMAKGGMTSVRDAITGQLQSAQEKKEQS
jgi:hypothetical protein